MSYLLEKVTEQGIDSYVIEWTKNFLRENEALGVKENIGIYMKLVNAIDEHFKTIFDEIENLTAEEHEEIVNKIKAEEALIVSIGTPDFSRYDDQPDVKEHHIMANELDKKRNGGEEFVGYAMLALNKFHDKIWSTFKEKEEYRQIELNYRTRIILLWYLGAIDGAHGLNSGTTGAPAQMLIAYLIGKEAKDYRDIKNDVSGIHNEMTRKKILTQDAIHRANLILKECKLPEIDSENPQPYQF